MPHLTLIDERMIYMRRILTLICISLALMAGSNSFAQAQSARFAPSDATSNALAKLSLSAKLTPKGDFVERGMVWRVFGSVADENGKLPLIATAKGGSSSFELPSGNYLIHATFGRAGATKKLALSNEAITEEFVLQAGGLHLTAATDGGQIQPKSLRFSIYEREQDEDGKRKLIALNVAAEKIVRLNAGTYHVLSRYGTINATVRADLQVKAGEVTKATLQHRGAKVALRLVSKFGGDPIANTTWAVFTQDGEKVFDSTNIAPSMILAEGTYEAAVRHGNDAVRRTFNVVSGENIRVEILLKRS